MGAAIKKITKKSWFYFLGVGGVATALFARMFLGGAGIISLSQLESDAKNAIMQTSIVGVINVANADIPGDGDGDSDSGSDCDSTDGADCGDGCSY